MLKVLFLCTGNSCRSQMAEGWARCLLAGSVEAYSAGIETHGLNPDAVAVMAEAGVDITGQRSQHLDEFKDVAFDLVVTVCDNSAESCPRFPGDTRVVHRPFDDPPRLAREAAADRAQTDGAPTDAERLAPYRRVRDEIRECVAGLVGSLEAADATGGTDAR